MRQVKFIIVLYLKRKAIRVYKLLKLYFKLDIKNFTFYDRKLNI